MAKLEVRYLSGDTETRELTRREPLSIGSHASNDVCVDDDDVGVLHCRIAWNKKEFEVTAANVEGVELNGTLVRKAPFRPGDVLRVGSVDILLQPDGDEADDAGDALFPESADADKSDKEAQGAANKLGSTGEIKLRPITEDEFRLPPPAPPPAPAPAETPERTPAKPKAEKKTKSKPKKEPMPDDDILDDVFEEADDESVPLPDDLFEEDDEVLAEDLTEGPAVPMLTRRGSHVEEEPAPESGPAEGDEAGRPPRPKGPSLITRVRTAMRSRAVRPGEQDIVRSPIVLTLTVGTAVLLLVGAVFFFMIHRETAKRMYEAAVAEKDQGKYTQAIDLFNKFLENHPHDSRVDMALIERGKCEIEREILGSSSNWSRGLDLVQEFIDGNRDREAFTEQQGELRSYAETIAMGAARTAERSKDESLIDVSVKAGILLERYSPAEAKPVELLKQIQAARESAQAAILKQREFDKYVTAIRQALDQKKPMQALAAREKLLQLYPDFAKERVLVELLEKTLETERSLVVTEELIRQALTEDHPPPPAPPLSLTLHTRSRTDETSIGRTVLAVGKDCCYGIDSVTGDPLWRRVIGLDTPFFPIGVQTAVDAVLLFDTDHQELTMLERRTGKLLWRQPIGEDVSGPPLVHAGEIYLPTLANNLYKMDVDTGRMTMRLGFSQGILAPPALISDSENKEWLIVAGDAALLYTLNTRPVECAAVTNLGHDPGTIQAPMVKMGRLVLLCENFALTKCRLRPLRLDDATKKVVSSGAREVPGQVRDAPALRGKTLFVPCGMERLEAFTVSDSPDQRPLTPIASHQLQNAVDSPMFLVVGPDGQVWMASTALRKLEIKTDSIKQDPAETAVGYSTQPLQSIGDRMYIGRQLPFSRAVIFSQANREEMTSHWRTVVGSQPLAFQVNADGTCVCVTEAGDVFRVTTTELERGGFKHEASVTLRLPQNLSDPLRVTPLDDGRIAIDCGGDEPQLWIVTSTGQPQQELKLDEPLEAGPVVLAGGLVLPLPGRLKLVSGRTASSAAKDLLAPVSQEKPARWVYLASLSETELLALDSGGKLLRVQYRQQPVPHLAEASTLELEAPADQPFRVHAGRIYLVDGNGKLRVLDASNLDTLTELPLEAPASNPPWVIGGRLYVECGREKLLCLEIEPELKPAWTLPLKGVGLTGPPVEWQQHVLLAFRDGQMWSVSPQTGQVAQRGDAGQPMSLPPQPVGEYLVVASIDGTLLRLPGLLQTAARASGD